MASAETDASADRRCRMLILNQKLDNPMDKEAEKLQGGYNQKVQVCLLSLLHLFSHGNVFQTGKWTSAK